MYRNKTSSQLPTSNVFSGKAEYYMPVFLLVILKGEIIKTIASF